ncbi:MAG: SDR family NAD(P)-dependent oxidoreductase [Chitinivibrionales bacterium]|nr:SDR family NAD(P)-dependent oxidoreductase [Chitinivibrionales bacterium]
MDKNLSGKTALITGAGRGIGKNIALHLAREGAHVVLSARSEHQINALAAEITRSGGSARTVTTDISREPEITSLFRTLKEQSASLDIMINNAGIGLFGEIADLSTEDFDRVISTNLRGTFLCCRQAMKIMIQQTSGYIINIASVVGIKGYPNQGAYTASKHGIMGLTKTLAVEAQNHGIRVSAILPGGVDTELAGQARPELDRSLLLSPEDISHTVLFLLSLSERAAIDQIYIRRKNSTPF